MAQQPIQYIITIDKNVVNEMPVVTYEGQIHIIDSVSQVAGAVRALRQAPIVGFDTETRPSFKRGEMHKVSLMQLSTLTHCFLFRLKHTGMPAPLKDYLEDAGCLKVGLSTHDDFKVLHRVYAFEPAGFVELQELVKRYEIGDLGLQKVFAILFQQKISKSQRLTNWDAARLTEAQQHYAALDAWACIRIYERLTSGQFDPLASPYRHVVEPPTTSD